MNRSLFAGTILLGALGFGWVARAGQTPTASPNQLHCPAGRAADPVATTGDYISATVANGGINDNYHYWIEVPPSTSSMTVELFDADTGNNYDRLRTNNSTCTYQLFQPNGTQQGGTITGTPTLPAGANNAWITLPTTGAIANPTAGHWEVRVTMANTGSDQNVFGLRAYNTSTGTGDTELNVYAENFIMIGRCSACNPSLGAGTTNYDLYPWITSGCRLQQSDFSSQDLMNVTWASRSSNFGNAPTEGGAGWGFANIGSAAPWTATGTDLIRSDYGIWDVQAGVTSSAGVPNNFVGLGIGISGAAVPPTANPNTNYFRIYLPTDGNAAPLKPFIAQTLTWISGPNPPVVGMQSIIRVNLVINNPTPHAITFNTVGTDVVTANVPGGGVTYNGVTTASQGTVTGPVIGGTGAVTWNPGGTVAANTVAAASYQIRVTAPAAARLAVTGTPGANGTQAVYIDETGSATQARARFTFGQLCELAITPAGTALPTRASIVNVRGIRSGDRAGVAWETASEVGTVGFRVLKYDLATREYVQVGPRFVPAMLGSSSGGHYEVIDATSKPGDHATYLIQELESASAWPRQYGPFVIDVPRVQGTAMTVPSALQYVRMPRVTLSALPHRAAPIFARSAVGNIGSSSEVDLSIAQPGLYFVAASEIAAELGVDEGTVVGWITAEEIALSHRGRAVHVLAATDSTGIYFYADKLQHARTRIDHYVLRHEPGAQMVGLSSALAGHVDGEQFIESVHLEEDHFPATAVFSLPNADFWLWDSIVAGDVSAGVKTFALPTPSLGSGVATIRLALKGATSTDASPDHRVRVRVNGVLLGESTFEGTDATEVTLVIADGILNDGANTLELEAVLDPGVAYSIVMLDSIDLSYPRKYVASAGALTLRAESNATITVAGFDDPDVLVLALDSEGAPQLVNSAQVESFGGGYRVSFTPTSPEVPYHVVTRKDALHPQALVGRNPSALRELAGTQFVLIAPRQLITAAEMLADLRRAQGLSSQVVALEDVFAEFSGGLVVPSAIPAFLSYAYGNWNVAPRYVALIGNGTYDYMDALGLGDNLIPPTMTTLDTDGLFAADSTLGDLVDFDGVPEIAVGRIPVTTAAELYAYVQKLQAFESSFAAPSGQALLIADDQDEGGDFGAEIASVGQSLPERVTANEVHFDGIDLAGARSRVQDALALGSSLLYFSGHAGVDRFTQEGLFTVDDVAQLTNGLAPVVTTSSCFAGGFAVPGFDTIGKSLVIKDGGGAVVVWAPIGLSQQLETQVVSSAFTRALFETDVARIGDAMIRSTEAGRAAAIPLASIRTFNLIGDPTVQLHPAMRAAGPDVTGKLPAGGVSETEAAAAGCSFVPGQR